MSRRGKVEFDVLSYASSRPTYPRSPMDADSNARWERAVDLGCGTAGALPECYLITNHYHGRTGRATFELTPFTHVLGLDPSENIVRSAREALKRREPQVDDTYDVGSGSPQSQRRTIEFVQSPTESPDFIADESVDLVIAAAFPSLLPVLSQSCHWFDWSRVWPQLARILRTGGTAAAWIYSEFLSLAHPHLTPLILHYSESHDTTSFIGRYWQQPGRNILSRHLLDVPEPSSIVATTTGAREIFEPLERIYFTELPPSQTLPILMRKTTTWSDILAYLRTWSALHAFREMHPEDAKNPEGPVEVRFWNSLRRGRQWECEMINPDTEVEVEWGVAMILARKKYDVDGKT
ncbi:S-adenosyl-L-methionine-dependent methyltransferase [Pisolithus microcarpus]|nr:S-adenosyl-L-methionine-dependent methyltransferase [Pisolithus microcarpus]